MLEHIQQRAVVPVHLDAKRFDQVASELFSDFSRSRLQQWIKSGELTLDGQQAKPKDKVFFDQELAIDAKLQVEEEWQAADIELDIVHEDDHVLVINKPVGLVVHPAAGHVNDTLLNGLLKHCPDLAHLPRAGIVHRLDKDTSGLLVVAKTLQAHSSLVAQLNERSVSREYEAIVHGHMVAGATINLPIGRHPRDRKKMAVNEITGKEAITHYRVIKRFSRYTHIAVKLETGRTHQIRVHMTHKGYALIGDQTYGGRMKIPAAASPEFLQTLRDFKRQALHARRLGFIHPATDDYQEWEAPLPSDMVSLLDVLQAHDGVNR